MGRPRRPRLCALQLASVVATAACALRVRWANVGRLLSSDATAAQAFIPPQGWPAAPCFHPLLDLCLTTILLDNLSPQLLPNLTVSLVKTYQDCSSGNGEIVVAAMLLIADWHSWVAPLPTALLWHSFCLAARFPAGRCQQVAACHSCSLASVPGCHTHHHHQHKQQRNLADRPPSLVPPCRSLPLFIKAGGAPCADQAGGAGGQLGVRQVVACQKGALVTLVQPMRRVGRSLPRFGRS